MFFKRKLGLLVIGLLLIFPISTFAYSSHIIASGKNIGIEIKSDGIMVVGLYNIDGFSPGNDANIHLGDRIIKINDNKVNDINEMIDEINNRIDENSIKISFIRNNKEYDTTLKLVFDDGIYKTGLYVKDTINGVGTLTFIDPGTKMYGALGHEIIDKNTSLKVEIKDGKIYKSDVVSITKSSDGSPGQKNAKYDSNVVYGSIEKNTSSGIFGLYEDEINSSDNLYKVASVDEIELGSAKILSVIENNEIKEYEIEITKINDSSSVKNISFNIVDETLLDKTGGIVQGMSGSPIIQNNMIIGAVTHVVVDDVTKGYGIYITNMLEEMEKEK